MKWFLWILTKVRGALLPTPMTSQEEIEEEQRQWRELFDRWKTDRKRVIGFGAAAKATVFLGWIGVGPDAMECVLDSTPGKIGKYIPGVGVEICSPDWLTGQKPDICVILAPNYKNELMAQVPEGIEVWCDLERIR